MSQQERPKQQRSHRSIAQPIRLQKPLQISLQKNRKPPARTMSVIRRGNVFDPFSLDLWDPFQGVPFGSGSGSLFARVSSDSETAAFAGGAIRLEGDSRGARVQGGRPGAEGGGEGGGRGRQRSPDQRRAQQGAGGEDGHLAPRGAQQRQVPAPVPAARERQDGADQGVHGERRAHRHRAKGGGQEAGSQVHPDLWLISFTPAAWIEWVRPSALSQAFGLSEGLVSVVLSVWCANVCGLCV
jgi:hypothetical protein